jgi:hypothetical protein
MTIWTATGSTFVVILPAFSFIFYVFVEQNVPFLSLYLGIEKLLAQSLWD